MTRFMNQFLLTTSGITGKEGGREREREREIGLLTASALTVIRVGAKRLTRFVLPILFLLSWSITLRERDSIQSH